MALTSVGAIFAINSKLLQRIYVPDFDDSEIFNQFIGTGETLQLVPIAVYANPPKGVTGPQNVQAAIGVPTINGRCAVVDDTNTCVALIVADPAIYIDPNGHQVILHDLADIGDTWNGTAFFRRFAEYNPITSIVAAVGLYAVNNPVPLNALNKLIASATLQIGQLVPVKV